MTQSASVSRIDDLETLFQAGEAFFNHNEMEKARLCFERIVAKNPLHLDALNDLGVVSFREGDHNRARELFAKVLSIDPGYKDALLNLVHLTGLPERRTGIMPLLERALESRPDDPELIGLLHGLKAERQEGVSPTLPRPQAMDAVFILSAGRSGALTLETILGLSDGISMDHDADPDAFKAALAAWRDGSDAGVFRRFRSRLLAAAREQGRIYGEAAPFLSPYAGAIARELPGARFIVLVRSPQDFVRSALMQNYYQGHPDDAFRPSPAPGSACHEAWKGWSQLEKICWLWTETYESILDAMEPAENGRYRVVHFEDISSGSPKIEELFEFLGIGGYSRDGVKDILKSRLNAQTYRHFPPMRACSAEVRGIVRDRCGAVAARLGYDAEIRHDHTIKPRHASVPAVSVGFPIYSGGAMLADSLESFLAQDFGDFEIIVSDHGSDPMVREVAGHYAALDKRIRYFPTEDRMRCIGAPNYVRVIELSAAPFFMWGSYDDRIEKSYIGKCLQRLRADDSVALAYTKSKVFQNHVTYLGTGNDTLHADQEDPCERFRNVIWELAMCNAFYGLFRREVLRKTRAFRKDAYAHDNLLLAEIALLGKIVQIDEPLFIRNLTRNYECGYDEHHTDMIRSGDAPWLEVGITLPFCRLTYSHCELINYSALPLEKKEFLTREVVRCFKARWEAQLRYEITRAVQLIHAGCFFRTWDGRHYGESLGERALALQHFYVADLIKALSEALFLYPEQDDLRAAYIKVLRASEALSADAGALSGDSHAPLPDMQPRH